MISLQEDIADLERLRERIQQLLPLLGIGKVESVAYDTAWIPRLPQSYFGPPVAKALDWLRQHQHEDGSWGADIMHYHDRFISTLAAIIALREAGRGEQDEQRIERGIATLWHNFSRLDEDDSDTIAFPLLSVSLMNEANYLGLQVPKARIRYAAAYEKRIIDMLSQSQPEWSTSPLVFSIEGLRVCIPEDNSVLAENGSICTSPAATVALLMYRHDESAFNYLQKLVEFQGDGGAPAVFPINAFEAIWGLNCLRLVGAIRPDDPSVRPILETLWQFWSTERGFASSHYFSIPDLDDTAGNFAILHWGGYPVQPSVFANYEMDEHFCCFLGETNPSLSAHLRLLIAIRQFRDFPEYEGWMRKIVNVLRKFDAENASWWDKWHASPYYVGCTAVRALQGIADDLVQGRINWILSTQNGDGGWGYFGNSTPEETSYCLDALLFVDQNVQQVPWTQVKAAADYLAGHVDDDTFTPLWIGKSLYTPYYVIKASILAALYAYLTHGDR